MLLFSASASGLGLSRTKRLTLKGLAVSLLIRPTASTIASGESRAAANDPSPPALLTAAASSADEALFIGPSTMGWVSPRLVMNGVEMNGMFPGWLSAISDVLGLWSSHRALSGKPRRQ